jgi:hypothetical protein
MAVKHGSLKKVLYRDCQCLRVERNILRKILGPTKDDNGIWRIKTNKELDELIKQRNIMNYVKSQTLSWFGHINRIPETSIVRKIYKWKPFTSRPLGRPMSEMT